MQITHHLTELRSILKQVQAKQHAIALVPTMGNLHAGHLHLVKLAQQAGSDGQPSPFVVVSIFVNPLQFGKGEDYSRYPRTLQADFDKLSEAGVDLVFAPDVQEMYPDYQPETQALGQHMLVALPDIADDLCGASRPGHFSGVATVVTKLFAMVQPDIAIFGKKDFQQLHIIRGLIRQFNWPIQLIAGETLRESDGLAMSSRNGYLSALERMEAPRLYKALQLLVQALHKAWQASTNDSEQTLAHDASTDAVFVKALAEMEQQTAQYLSQLGWIVDYVAIRSATTLQIPQASEPEWVVLIAARLGKTRLIDNIEYKHCPEKKRYA